MSGDHTNTRIWQGISSAEPPCLWSDFGALLKMATTMLESRQHRFPQMVASGTLDHSTAEQQIRLFSEIVADWTFIAEGRGEPASTTTENLRRDALDESLATIAAIARQEGGFSKSLEYQAQCVIALRWHLEPRRRTALFADITHQLRANAEGKEKEISRCH